MNARVLRFPNNGGTIAHDADVVLGQLSFTTQSDGGATRGLDQLLLPMDVAADPITGNIYVADVGTGPADSRILEFAPPFSSAGTAAVRALPLSVYCDFAFPALAPVELTLDTLTHQLWVHNSCFFTELFTLDGTPTASVRVKVPQADGVDVDSEGSLFVVGKWSNLYRFDRKQLGLDYQANAYNQEAIFSGHSPSASDSLSGGLGGVTVFGSQLIVADADRLLIWNDYDASTLQHAGQPLRNAEPADDLYGESTFDSEVNLYGRLQYFAYPQALNGQLWVERRTLNNNDVMVFSGPLSHSPAPGPVTVPLTARSGGTCTGGTCTVNGTPCGSDSECSFSGYPLLGSRTLISCGSADAIDFVPLPSGDGMWVADRGNNRVFRVADLWGQPYVDVILGQATATADACNRGGTAAPNRLCIPYDVALDANGNLYISDNGGEVGTNRRILEFDAALFPSGVNTAIFGVPPTRMFPGTAQFDISPFKPAFHPYGAMVIGNNAYSGRRVPMVYLNPLSVQTPQLELGDLSSYPAASPYFDPYGNLYFADSDWSHAETRSAVLIVPRGGVATTTPGATSERRAGG